MSDTEISAPVARTKIGRPFQPGTSPNPGGRSKVARDIQALARQHGPAAIATLAQALTSRNERVRVAAAGLLLDRAYGRPATVIATPDGNSPVQMHLIAAGLVSREILEMRAEPVPHQLEATALDMTKQPTE